MNAGSHGAEDAVPFDLRDRTSRLTVLAAGIG